MTKAFTPREAYTWAGQHNLSLIVDFHNEVRRNFQNEIAKIDRKLEKHEVLSGEEIAQLEARKRSYTDTFEPYLRINTFLLMVSHLEEWLFHAWKHHAPETGLLEAKGSIGRFKPVLKEIGVDLSRSGPWMFLKGCQDVRSCLLHANGRVSLNRDPERIRNFVAQNGGTIRIVSDSLVLEEKFLQRVREQVEQLIQLVKPA